MPGFTGAVAANSTPPPARTIGEISTRIRPRGCRLPGWSASEIAPASAPASLSSGGLLADWVFRQTWRAARATKPPRRRPPVHGAGAADEREPVRGFQQCTGDARWRQRCRQRWQSSTTAPRERPRPTSAGPVGRWGVGRPSARHGTRARSRRHHPGSAVRSGTPCMSPPLAARQTPNRSRSSGRPACCAPASRRRSPCSPRASVRATRSRRPECPARMRGGRGVSTQ